MAAPPSIEVLSHLTSGFVRVTRRVEILASNGEVLWNDIGLVDGQVNVDASRDERRTLDITLSDTQGRLEINEFWYDKLIRPWRGISWRTGAWETPLGTFMVDTISDVQRVKRRHRPRAFDSTGNLTNTDAPFMHVVQVTGRDLTKRLITSKFSGVTTFVAGTGIDVIIAALANDALIVGLRLPWSGSNPAPVLEIDQTFEAGSTRWAAIAALCLNYGYEAFIDVDAFLTVRLFRDPATMLPVWSFQTGPSDGNLASYKRVANDSELYNRVVVRGSGQTNAFIFAEVAVTDSASPIHSSQIGDRMYPYDSPTVATNEQAYALAVALLQAHSLQSYEINLGSIVLPWMEAGEVVQFLDVASNDDPMSLFLSNFSIPMSLSSTMDGVAKRVLSAA